MPTKRQDLNALRTLLKELERLHRMGPLPASIAARSAELLTTSIALTEDLIEQTPAAFLGSLGGQETAKRGPEYFARIAGMRKERKGGRPRKSHG